MKVPGPKRSYAGGSLVCTIEIHRKIINNLLLQNHLPKVLEISSEALSSDYLPSLLNGWSMDAILPLSRGSQVRMIK